MMYKCTNDVQGLLPNKRLKLSGALVGRIALPCRLALSAAPPPCAPGHCARCLTAIR